MIPFPGAITTCVAALLIALVQFGDWLHPLLVLAVFGVVQTSEGLVISPKIMGDRVGLHPLTIIVLIVGTTMLGAFSAHPSDPADGGAANADVPLRVEGGKRRGGSCGRETLNVMRKT